MKPPPSLKKIYQVNPTLHDANKLSLSVQYADDSLKSVLTRSKIRRWVQAALLAPAQITIRFVNEEEGRILNKEYRHKNYPTNVLTFTYHTSEKEITKADIILCSPVLKKEAKEQNKTLQAHATHLIVHGILHAQGYDHENEDEAKEMESLEIQILSKFHITNPYQETR
jgi:probable rRNA maturation factor